MKRIAILSIAILCFCGTLKAEEKTYTQNKEEDMKMEIMPKGTQKSFKGPEDMFTGDVQIDMLFPSNEVAHYSGAYVIFQPGARTAWHLHPAGQHMIVTSGIGLTGTRDGKIVTMKTGDTVWCPPDIDHWHGATPDSPMTHLVVTGELNGKNVVWKEKVTDDQYLGK
jgi:4-carboxymuconolactone decarboxylase